MPMTTLSSGQTENIEIQSWSRRYELISQRHLILCYSQIHGLISSDFLMIVCIPDFYVIQALPVPVRPEFLVPGLPLFIGSRFRETVLCILLAIHGPRQRHRWYYDRSRWKSPKPHQRDLVGRSRVPCRFPYLTPTLSSVQIYWSIML